MLSDMSVLSRPSSTTAANYLPMGRVTYWTPFIPGGTNCPGSFAEFEQFNNFGGNFDSKGERNNVHYYLGNIVVNFFEQNKKTGSIRFIQASNLISDTTS